MFIIHFLNRSIESTLAVGAGGRQAVGLMLLFSFSQNKVVDVDNLKVKLQVRTEKLFTAQPDIVSVKVFSY